MTIDERASTHIYRQKQMFSKDELAERETLCIHEEPAYCNAACPLKLDMKDILVALAKGDFDKAYALYAKNTPFPHLLAEGCEAPCEKACKLGELGEGIAIQRLEQALTHYGIPAKGRGGLRMKKKKTVAICGSGLFALFLAGELAKKNYPLAVYCAEADCAEWLAAETAGLSDETRAQTLAELEKMDVQFHFQSALDRAFLEELRAKIDILCASMSVVHECLPTATPDQSLMYLEEENLVCGTTAGVLDSAFGAKKAALTVDRLAQKLHPSNTRGEEGAVSTRLYTSLEGVAPSRRIAAEGLYSREQAIAEAQRCIQCHCDECIKACAYLQHYKKFPRQLTREIYNNVSIIMGDHVMNRPINSCSLCGQCQVVCPNGYDMAEVCHLARQNMVDTGKMPLAPHEFALMDMMFSNGDAFLARPQVGFETCDYVFFPGCQMSAIAPATVRAAYRDLCTRLSGGVGLVLGCCGVIADWAGRTELFEKTQVLVKDALQQLGNPTIICACPTCQKTLDGFAGMSTVGIWQLLEEIGLPAEAEDTPRVVALHDSCGARGNAATQNVIRDLAAKLHCEIVPTAYEGDTAPCCGYGGLTQYANREVAEEMTAQCLSRSEAPYLTYCMACRDRFARQGRESMHILELVYGTSADHCPDISQKRYNRLGLKQQLLSELWKEEFAFMNVPFEIDYTPEALRQMDDRMILKSDVAQVLTALRETNEAVLDEETGISVTRARLGNVTVWVKYQETDDGYRVVGAYSHRMGIAPR